MVFYFSGTGNTKWVATQIAELLKEDLYAIPELRKKGIYEFRLAANERIGFCFPTHGWQPPRIVREFIRQLHIYSDNHIELNSTSSQPYCWALTTCGDETGETMTILSKELSRKGLSIEAAFSIIMPETYVCLPFMKTDTEEKEALKLDMAQHQIPHIATLIKERRQGVEELVKGPVPRIYSYVLGNYFNKRMVHDRKFTVDTKQCIQCGKCQSICPVDNIKGAPPIWLHNGQCTACLACYHYCPVHAINFGRITHKRGQYYFNRREVRK